MLDHLAAFVVRHARAVLAVAVVVLVGAGVVGAGAFGQLQSEGFTDPGAESVAAAELIEAAGGQADLVLLATAAGGGSVDDAAAGGTALTERIAADPAVTGARSYWTTDAPSLRSADGSRALILVTLADPDSEDGAAVAERFRGEQDGLRVVAGGPAVVQDEVVEQVAADLLVAEAIAVPLILVLLVFAFGSLVAALLPLAIGLVAIVGTFAELAVLAANTDVSVFSINLTTALGLGLAIDYALLVVGRFREELARDADGDVPAAVVRTIRTAGRAVVFSGLAVAAALAALLVFPLYFLRSFAYAGIGVVVISVVAVLTVLPALLTVLGHRVDAGRVPWTRAARSVEAPFWGRLARWVMRRPALAVLPVVGVLLALAAPVLGITFGMPDDRVLPTSAESRQVGDALRDDFPAGEANALDVVTTGPVDQAALADYATRLSELPGVERVDTGLAAPEAGAELLAVVTAADPTSGAARDLVRDVRAVPPPDGADALVGGSSAQLVDTLDAVGAGLPVAAGMIALTTFVILFLFTGSVVQPLRALLSNVLVLAATFGVLVMVFQDGALSGVLGFTPAPLNTAMILLLFCIVFGLSMDYEVFVMSRIREQVDAGASIHDATVTGLARTGRIVTTAAALLAVSFFAFLTGQVSFLQLFGLGCGLAILLDATVVRGVLVPASMRLLGRHAWYAPRVLRRLHARVGLSEA
ncbi:MMPL family transporter [Jiangella mangrovi]|uniref:RND superfamily putative drug exporter n=1 Tax=Jiangella mangrovi TaxID=1524084 RepID=A0A7W9LK46_9ACTN|nr:MMPL family transporter [Jiangella mangrovi]MBB5786704.1 RND superfamily putative drug exporter [Jiangella mangrovi]